MSLNNLKTRLLYCRYNILLFVLTVVSLYANFLFFSFQMISIKDFPKIGFVTFLLNSIVFALPYFWFKKKDWFFAYLFLINFMLIANLIYYYFFGALIPFFSYFLLGNINDQFGSLLNYLRPNCILFFINTLLLFVIYFVGIKKRLQYFLNFTKRMSVSFVLLIFTVGIYGSMYFVSDSMNADYSVIKPHRIFTFGFLPVWISDINEYCSIDSSPLTAAELLKIEKYESAIEHTINPVNNTERKNLVIILVESLDLWVTQFDDGAPAPFLKTLQQSDNTIFVPNVLTQVSVGRSSDAQVMINTGLLPTTNYVCVNTFDKQYYPSLAEALKEKQYFSATVVGSRENIWNQGIMNYNYHYDELISKKNLISDTLTRSWIADRSVFRQTLPIYKKKTEKQSLFLQIITLSSHYEDDFADVQSEYKFPQNMNNSLKNYIKSIEYVDDAIRFFIESLKKEGLFENTVIVITGDHSSGCSNMYLKDYDEKLWNKFKNMVPLYIISVCL